MIFLPLLCRGARVAAANGITPAAPVESALMQKP